MHDNLKLAVILTGLIIFFIIDSALALDSFQNMLNDIMNAILPPVHAQTTLTVYSLSEMLETP